MTSGYSDCVNTEKLNEEKYRKDEKETLKLSSAGYLDIGIFFIEPTSGGLELKRQSEITSKQVAPTIFVFLRLTPSLIYIYISFISTLKEK